MRVVVLAKGDIHLTVKGVEVYSTVESIVEGRKSKRKYYDKFDSELGEALENISMDTVELIKKNY